MASRAERLEFPTTQHQHIPFLTVSLNNLPCLQEQSPTLPSHNTSTQESRSTLKSYTKLSRLSFGLAYQLTKKKTSLIPSPNPLPPRPHTHRTPLTPHHLYISTHRSTPLSTRVPEPRPAVKQFKPPRRLVHWTSQL
jgi:hypothetical protein